MRFSPSTMMIKLSMAVIAAMLSAVAGANAQSYPLRPITMLVGYAVGGPSDTIARIA
jgi:tripartite-type tricarboxylate transporter receptor subunit TctC